MDRITLKNHHGRIIELKYLKERIEELEKKLTSIKAQTITDEPRGGKSEDTSDAIIKLADVKAEYDERREEFFREEDEIDKAIKTLNDPRHRTVMRYRYVSLLDWEDVADKVGYSEAHTKKIHGDALKELFRKDNTK